LNPWCERELKTTFFKDWKITVVLQTAKKKIEDWILFMWIWDKFSHFKTQIINKNRKREMNPKATGHDKHAYQS
jgi:hypothetical protein